MEAQKEKEHGKSLYMACLGRIPIGNPATFGQTMCSRADIIQLLTSLRHNLLSIQATSRKTYTCLDAQT